MKNWPMPVPSTKAVTTSCARLGSSGTKVPASTGSAGRIESIENAIIDISAARSSTSSAKGRGRVGLGRRMGVPFTGVMPQPARNGQSCQP